MCPILTGTLGCIAECLLSDLKTLVLLYPPSVISLRALTETGESTKPPVPSDTGSIQRLGGICEHPQSHFILGHSQRLEDFHKCPLVSPVTWSIYRDLGAFVNASASF